MVKSQFTYHNLSIVLMSFALVPPQHPLTSATPQPEFCNDAFLDQLTFDVCQDGQRTFSEDDLNISNKYCHFNHTTNEYCCPRPAEIFAAVRPSARHCDSAHSLGGPIIFRERVKRSLVFSHYVCGEEFKKLSKRQQHMTVSFCRYNQTVQSVCCPHPAEIEKRFGTAINYNPDGCDPTSPCAQIPIVFGRLTKPREFPYMCAIGWRSTNRSKVYDYKCGGVLINGKFVITAAHCLYYADRLPIVVLPGGVNLDSAANNIHIIDIIEHPKYKFPSAYNDIAILLLAKEPGNDGLPETTACLWTGPLEKSENVVAIGYGDTKFDGPNSNALLKTNLTLISNAECSSYHEPEISWLSDGIVGTQLCASDPEGLRDTCQGDSGGPIIMYANCTGYSQIPFVVGITSFGVGCAHGVPGVYTRISEYIDWIEQVIWSAT